MSKPPLQTQLLPTHTPQLFKVAVVRAVELLAQGDLVALPTETVYGLAANALDAKAVAKIYEVKGRPPQNPIIVHVCDVEMAKKCVSTWPDSAKALARAFWPGPLTLVLNKAKNIPDNVTASGETVGIRWPSHPFIQAVIRDSGLPLAAPSANPSNGISPTNASHVLKGLGGKVLLVVDGGQSQVGIESTVVDLTGIKAKILRPGIIHLTALQAAMPELEWEVTAIHQLPSGKPLRSPGQMLRHYSPKAKLEMREWKDSAELELQLAKTGVPFGKIHLITHTQIPSSGDYASISVIPHDAEAFARAIYAELHTCDESGAELIVVEKLPDENEWHAIADRLTRASVS
jgi:L-threonylcarbamoyladenylate synthase